MPRQFVWEVILYKMFHVYPSIIWGCYCSPISSRSTEGHTKIINNNKRETCGLRLSVFCYFITKQDDVTLIKWPTTGWICGVRFATGAGILSSSSRSENLWRPPSRLSNGADCFYSGNKTSGVWSWSSMLMHLVFVLKLTAQYFRNAPESFRVRIRTKFASFLPLTDCVSEIVSVAVWRAARVQIRHNVTFYSEWYRRSWGQDTLCCCAPFCRTSIVSQFDLIIGEEWRKVWASS